jgi:hypothetical protein
MVSRQESLILPLGQIRTAVLRRKPFLIFPEDAKMYNLKKETTALPGG